MLLFTLCHVGPCFQPYSDILTVWLTPQCFPNPLQIPMNWSKLGGTASIVPCCRVSDPFNQLFEVVTDIIYVLWTLLTVCIFFTGIKSDLFLLKPDSLLTSSDTTVFPVMILLHQLLVSECWCNKKFFISMFCRAEKAGVSYGLNVIDTFPLWSQPITRLADMEISGKANTNVN